MSGYLSEILAAHRARAGRDRRDLGTLVEQAMSAPPARPFADRVRAVATTSGLAVVAEVKRRSPSKGELVVDLDPAGVAREYVAGGAACISVLTDGQFFGGSAADLAAVRTAVDAPILRKDFTVSLADVCDARLMGADAVLLIAAALERDEMASMASLAGDLGLDVLVEVHDEVEMEQALGIDAGLVGVNRRDLTTFDVDPERTDRLIAALPSDVVAIAESGVNGESDAAHLAASGFQGVLVGEYLVRSVDRASAVAALGGHRVGPRRLSVSGAGERTPA
ncbi:MAG: indole-3-glycerol phosphate synthase TrpC [Acidimicrobiales bacterium]